MKLQHPSIPSIIGVYRGRRRGSVYLIMELFDTNLDELFQCGSLLTQVDSLAINNSLE